MDTHIGKYQKLYALQDKVLNSIFKYDTDFYLTGGTCLNRFISPRRYSDDLDFFSGDSALFRDFLREVLAGFHDANMQFNVEVDTRDFIRLTIENTLKVDMVNDRVFRCGHSKIIDQGYRIDNIHNLLANKLSALIGRDEPKDIFDITTIRLLGSVDWKAALTCARKKSAFETDYLVYRLQSFPVKLLDYLAVVKPTYITECKDTVQVIIHELEKNAGI